MKIIELLNKIANGEEVPKVIKYHNTIYYYDKYNFQYAENKDTFNTLLSEFNGCKWVILNEEVEIIEEPKEHKIPEKINIKQEKNIKNNWKWKVYGKEHSYNISTPQKIIADKINEILDYLETSKNKKD